MSEDGHTSTSCLQSIHILGKLIENIFYPSATSNKSLQFDCNLSRISNFQPSEIEASSQTEPLPCNLFKKLYERNIFFSSTNIFFDSFPPSPTFLLSFIYLISSERRCAAVCCFMLLRTFQFLYGKASADVNFGLGVVR